MRRPETDRREADFFSDAAPTPAAPEQRPTSNPKPKPEIKRQPPPPDIADTPPCDSIDVLAARLSRTEWNELVAALPDDVLAHSAVATVRQLRRRLARSRGRDGKGRAPALEPSARQLIDELGGQGESDDDGWAEWHGAFRAPAQHAAHLAGRLENAGQAAYENLLAVKSKKGQPGKAGTACR